MRVLRGKLRRKLRRWADYRCEECGAPLDDEWHADHVVPWCVTGRTDVDDMQALCVACNLEKGAHMIPQYLPRAWQKSALDILDSVASGANPRRKLFAFVVTGGGKSHLPVYASVKLRGLAPTTIWAAPRRNLVRAGTKAFNDPSLRAFLNHRHSLFDLATNNPLQARGTHGYVTTYDMLRSDPREHLSYMRRHGPAILVLDEVQFAEEDNKTAQALADLIGEAAYLVLMSGTPERHNKQPVTGIEYGPDDKPRLERTTTQDFVRYSRKDGLTEGSIIPMDVDKLDGDPGWVETATGATSEYDSLADVPRDETGKAIKTLVAMPYARELIDRTVDHWQQWRIHNPNAKLMVIAPDIATGRGYLTHLRQRVPNAEMAATDDAPAAIAIIDRFKGDKGPECDALATVAMAYVGMDCPAVTHMAVLTRYRSKPWIEQMIGRATRFDPRAGLSWDDQRAFIFVPDDAKMNAIIADILAEQIAALADLNANGGGGGGEGPPTPDHIDPQRGNVQGATSTDTTTGEIIPDPDLSEYRDAAAAAGMPGLTPHAFKALQDELERRKKEGPPAAPPPRETPAEALKRDKDEADRRVKAYCYRQQQAMPMGDPSAYYVRLNGRIKSKFGRARQDMSQDEITALLTWLDREGIR